VYTPAHFVEGDPEKIAAFVDLHGFGQLITVVNGVPFASHIPFLYDPDAGVLRAHVARANPQWEQLSDREDVLVVFQGPHTYISPSWYASHGVPTWNYVAVHIYGIARALTEPASVESIVLALTEKYERANSAPWVPKYDPKMLCAIVGLEIRVKEVQGKFKLSQNRSAADREAVILALARSPDSNAKAVAQLMKRDEL
jgi:transcriptional regulator